VYSSRRQSSPGHSNGRHGESSSGVTFRAGYGSEAVARRFLFRKFRFRSARCSKNARGADDQKSISSPASLFVANTLPETREMTPFVSGPGSRPLELYGKKPYRSTYRCSPQSARSADVPFRFRFLFFCYHGRVAFHAVKRKLKSPRIPTICFRVQTFGARNPVIIHLLEIRIVVIHARQIGTYLKRQPYLLAAAPHGAHKTNTSTSRRSKATLLYIILSRRDGVFVYPFEILIITP